MDGNWKLCSAFSDEQPRAQWNHIFYSKKEADSKIGILKIKARAGRVTQLVKSMSSDNRVAGSIPAWAGELCLS